MPVVVSASNLQERAESSEYTISKKSLMTAIPQVSLAIQSGFVEDHALTHVRVRGDDQKLIFESTDRIRYTRVTVPGKTKAKGQLVGFVKRDDLPRLTRVVQAAPDEFPLTIQDNAVVLGNGAKFVSEYRHVLSFPQLGAFVRGTKESRAVVTVSRKGLIGSLKSCIALIKRLVPDDVYSGITLLVNDDVQLRVGQVKISNIDAKHEGKKSKIEFNGKLLIDALRLMPEPSVELRLYDEPKTLRVDCGAVQYIQAPLV